MKTFEKLQKGIMEYFLLENYHLGMSLPVSVSFRIWAVDFISERNIHN